jgi:hypothetical protein
VDAVGGVEFYPGIHAVVDRGVPGALCYASVHEVLAPEDSLSADTEVASPRDRNDTMPIPEIPDPGDRIGRFTVLEVLGRGGMGVVVAAYDPQLDRSVALKIVSADGEGERQEYRARLLREARAMAKIRHPNVVAVHEVGEHGGRVYLAMEQVDGGTLRTLGDGAEEASFDWRSRLDVFIAAGRGLAAAHAAGMVHRDFKPENVLIEEDGEDGRRVLVGDFGLVGHAPARDAPGEADASVYERLTRADAVMGTPAYMAPEQYTGTPVDARADQFGFCVTLYESLFGVLPFRGETRNEYVRAIMHGELREPPAGRKVPGWLLQVIRRGLAADPAARYPSMNALLAELSADPRSEWRRGWRERAMAIAATASFLVAWPVTMIGLGIELDYRLSHIRNLGILVIISLVALIGRRAFARTAFNRKFIGFGLAGGIIVTVLAIGAQAMAIPPEVLRTLHLAMVGCLMTTVAVALDRRVAVCAAVYLGGYLMAAAWPSSYLVAVVSGHTVGAINLFIVLTNPRPAV